MKVLIASIAFSLFYICTEVITRRESLHAEISRKLVHILSGVAVAFLPLVMSFHEIAILGLVFIPIMLISKKLNLLTAVHNVKRKTNGEIYFPLAVTILAVVFPKLLPFMFGMLVMGISDGLASIAGGYLKWHTYRCFGASKTMSGSLVFFASSLIIGVILLQSISDLTILLTIIYSTCCAIILTITEAILSRGIDNLVLPVVAAVLFTIVR
jgi:dolichol kinase